MKGLLPRYDPSSERQETIGPLTLTRAARRDRLGLGIALVLVLSGVVVEVLSELGHAAHDLWVAAGIALVFSGLALLLVRSRLRFSLRDRALLGERLSDINRTLAGAAVTDALTGLGNRARLAQVCDDSALAAERVLVIIDLDDFKAINNTFGYPTGDRVLCEVAGRLGETARPGDTLVRVGADEFAMLLSPADGAVGRTIAAGCLAALEQPLEIDGHTIFVRASAGVAVATAGEPLASLMRHAGASLYRAKHDGGGALSVFDPGVHDEILDELALTGDLRGALARAQLVLHYQPIVDMGTRRTVGFEALVRWNHPEHGLLGPFSFIQLAEDHGLMPAIGQWIVEQACRDAAGWRARCSQAPYVSINLSVRQLQDPGFLEGFRRALDAAALPAAAVVVEVTETAAVTLGLTGIGVPLQELRRLGVRVYLDDFGTGYSSLGSIRELPIDGVKLDRAFSRELTTSPEALALAQVVVALLGTLHLELTAEGVETASQLAQLRSLGCVHAQGYYFARPRPADAIDDLMIADLVLASS